MYVDGRMVVEEMMCGFNLFIVGKDKLVVLKVFGK